MSPAGGEGPVLAQTVSERLGRIGPEEARRVQAVLARFPRPPAMPRPARDQVRAALGRDKKASARKIRYVVLDGIGHGVIEPAVPEDLLAFAIDRALESL